MSNNYRLVKLGCYTTNITMSIVGNISPLLFMTFRNLYGISYSLLGLLVLINFMTQLAIDLIFSFFSHKFNINMAVKLTPVLAMLGLGVYSYAPFIFADNVYVGLVIGTVIFSAAGGFCEVLISPVIAAIPSDNPDREMSKLHSIYAWGVVGMIVVSSLYIHFVGSDSWYWLTLAFAAVPLASALLFMRAELPVLETPGRVSGVLEFFKSKALWLCVVAIFLGGAAECTMAQWCSGYLEKALGVNKLWGDLFGTALFAMMLGLGRTLYAKIGKNVSRVLFLGALGATLCYLVAAISPFAILGLIACAFTGFCVSMLWPGSLIVSSERFPHGGVFLYAMMASGGDFGAAIAPQLVGNIADIVAASDIASGIASNIGMTAEQLGMKCGILIGMIFSLTAVFVYLYIMRTSKKVEKHL